MVETVSVGLEKLLLSRPIEVVVVDFSQGGIFHCATALFDVGLTESFPCLGWWLVKEVATTIASTRCSAVVCSRLLRGDVPYVERRIIVELSTEWKKWGNMY